MAVKKGNWISNFGNSVKFSAVNVMSEMMPGTSRIFGGTNAEFVSGIMDTLGQLRRGQSKLSNLFEKMVGKERADIGRGAFSDIADDFSHFLKTGQVTRPEKEDDFGFGDDDMDMDFGEGDDIDFSKDLDMSDLPSPDEIKTVSKNATPLEEMTSSTGQVEIAAINDQTRANVAIGEMNAQAIAKVGEATEAQTSILGGALAQSNQLQVKMSMSEEALTNVLHSKTMKGLEAINNNLTSIVTFQHDSMAKFTMGALKYYDDSIKELQNIGGILSRAFPAKKKEELVQSDYDKAGMTYGGFDIPGYLEVVKKNFLYNTQIGMMLESFADPEMLKMMLANPGQMIAESVVEYLIPNIAKMGLKRFDETISNFFPAMAAKLYKMGNSFDANPILQFLGSVFGIAPPSTYTNLRGFEKGPVPFDGITHRTINHVIPSYLSEIVSALTGKERQMYNMEMGRFETITQMKDTLHNEEMSSMKQAIGYDILEKIEDRLKDIAYETKSDPDKLRRDIHEGLLEIVKKGEQINPYKLNTLNSDRLIKSPAAAEILKYVFANDLRPDEMMKIGAATHNFAQNQYNINQRRREADNRHLVIYDQLNKTNKIIGQSEEPDEERKLRLKVEEINKSGFWARMIPENLKIIQKYDEMKKRRLSLIKEDEVELTSTRKDVVDKMAGPTAEKIYSILEKTYTELAAFHADFNRTETGRQITSVPPTGLPPTTGPSSPLPGKTELDLAEAKKANEENLLLEEAQKIVNAYNGYTFNYTDDVDKAMEYKSALEIVKEANKKKAERDAKNQDKFRSQVMQLYGLQKEDYDAMIKAEGLNLQQNYQNNQLTQEESDFVNRVFTFLKSKMNEVIRSEEEEIFRNAMSTKIKEAAGAHVDQSERDIANQIFADVLERRRAYIKMKRKGEQAHDKELTDLGLYNDDEYRVFQRAKTVRAQIEAGQQVDGWDQQSLEALERELAERKKIANENARKDKEAAEVEGTDRYTRSQIREQKKGGKRTSEELLRRITSDHEAGIDPQDYISDYFTKRDEKKLQEARKGVESAEDRINKLADEGESFFGNIAKMINSPFSTIAYALRGVERTLVTIVFGSGSRDKGLLRAITDNITDTFKIMQETIKEEFYNPLKKILFGEANFKDSPLYQGIQSGISSIKAILNDDYDDLQESERVSDKQAKREARRKEEESEKVRQAREQREESGRRIRRFLERMGTDYKEFSAEERTLAGRSINMQARAPYGGGKAKAGDMITFNNTEHVVDKDGKEVKEAKPGEPYILKEGEQVASKSHTPPHRTEQQLKEAERQEKVDVTNVIQSAISDNMSRISDGLQNIADNVKEGTAKTDEVAKNTEEGNKIATEAAKARQEEAKKNTANTDEGKGKQPNSIASNFKEMLDDIGRNISAHLFGDSLDKEGKQKPIMENIGDMFAKGARSFSNFFFGTTYDTEAAVDSYKKELKKSIPRGTARGLMLGAGLGLTSMAGSLGGFGLLGSIFLPGGIIGSMILGLGAGFALESEGFKKWLFGEKDEQGKRMGGKISRKTLDWFDKNKKALLGGAAVGLWSGITHLGPMNLLAALLPGGAGMLTTMAVGAVGPVTLSIAAALAMNSEKFQNKIFGKKDDDGKRTGGLINASFTKELRKALPNVAVGAGLGGLAALAGSQLGILGSLMITPYAGAILGGVTGFMLTTKKFRETLFGVQDEKGTFIKGGLVDKLQNLIEAEVVNPLANLVKKEIFRAGKWFRKSILNPLADSVVPYKLFINSIISTSKKAVKHIIDKLTGRIRSAFSPIINAITSILGSLARGLRDTSATLLSAVTSVARTLISMPMKLVTAPANFLRGYYRDNGTDEQKQLISESDAAIAERNKQQDEEFAYEEEQLRVETEYRKNFSKFLRSRGYEATEEQLAKKTEAYMREQQEKKLREEQRKMEEEQLRVEEEQNAKLDEQLLVQRKIFDFLRTGKSEDKDRIKEIQRIAKFTPEQQQTLDKIAELEKDPKIKNSKFRQRMLNQMKAKLYTKGVLAGEEELSELDKLTDEDRYDIFKIDQQIEAAKANKNDQELDRLNAVRKQKMRSGQVGWEKREEQAHNESVLSNKIFSMLKNNQEGAITQFGLQNRMSEEDKNLLQSSNKLLENNDIKNSDESIDNILRDKAKIYARNVLSSGDLEQTVFKREIDTKYAANSERADEISKYVEENMNKLIEDVHKQITETFEGQDKTKISDMIDDARANLNEKDREQLQRVLDKVDDANLSEEAKKKYTVSRDKIILKGRLANEENKAKAADIEKNAKNKFAPSSSIAPEIDYQKLLERQRQLETTLESISKTDITYKNYLENISKERLLELKNMDGFIEKSKKMQEGLLRYMGDEEYREEIRDRISKSTDMTEEEKTKKISHLDKVYATYQGMSVEELSEVSARRAIAYFNEKKKFEEENLDDWKESLQEKIYDIITNSARVNELEELKGQGNFSEVELTQLNSMEDKIKTGNLSEDQVNMLNQERAKIYSRGLLSTDINMARQEQLTSTADELFDTTAVGGLGVKRALGGVVWDPNADINNRDMHELSAEAEQKRREEESWREKLYNVLNKQLGVSKDTIAKGEDWFNNLKDLLMGLLGAAGILGMLQLIKNLLAKFLGEQDNTTIHDERAIRDLVQIAVRKATRSAAKTVSRNAAQVVARSSLKERLLQKAASVKGGLVDIGKKGIEKAGRIATAIKEGPQAIKERISRGITHTLDRIPGYRWTEEGLHNVARGFIYGPADRFNPKTGMYEVLIKNDKGKYVKQQLTRKEYYQQILEKGLGNSVLSQEGKLAARGGVKGVIKEKTIDPLVKFAKDWTIDSKLGKFMQKHLKGLDVNKPLEEQGLRAKATQGLRNVKAGLTSMAENAKAQLKSAKDLFLHGYFEDGLDKRYKGFRATASGKFIDTATDSKTIRNWGESGGLEGQIKAFQKTMGELKSNIGRLFGEMKDEAVKDIGTLKEKVLGGKMYQSIRGNMIIEGVRVGDVIDAADHTLTQVKGGVEAAGKSIASTADKAISKVAGSEGVGSKILERAKGAKEDLYEVFMKHCRGALDVIKNNETVKKYLGEGVSGLIKKLAGAIGKCTKEVFVHIAPKVAKAMAKTAALAGGALFAGIGALGVQGVFTLYDIYSGAVDAAEMWQVRSEDVSAEMRLACVILNVIMGLGPMVWVDLALEAVYLGSSMMMGEEDAINIKREILLMIYESLPNNKGKDQIEELQKKRKSDYEDYLNKAYDEAYKQYQENGGTATREEWDADENLKGAVQVEGFDTWDHKQHENEHPILDKAREYWLGRELFGYTDENGQFVQGLFGDAKDFIFGNDEKGTRSVFVRVAQWLFGDDELDENGNPKNKGVIPTAIDTISGFIDGVTQFFKDAKKFIFDMSFDEKLTTIWKFLIGGENDEGEYKLGIIPKLWGAIGDFVDSAVQQFKKLGTVFSVYSENENPLMAGIDTIGYLVKSFLGWEDDGRGVIVQSISRFLHSDILRGPTDFFDNLGTQFDSFLSDVSDKGPFDLVSDMLVGLLGWDRKENEGLVDIAFRKLWDEGIKVGFDSIAKSFSDFGDWYTEIWKIYQEEIKTKGPWDALLNFLKRFMGFDPDTSWKDMLIQTVQNIVYKVRDGITAIGDKFDDLRTWWKRFSLIDTVRDMVLWPLKKFAPDTYEAIMNTLAFGNEAGGDSNLYETAKFNRETMEYSKDSQIELEDHQTESKRLTRDLMQMEKDLENAVDNNKKKELQSQIDELKKTLEEHHQREEELKFKHDFLRNVNNRVTTNRNAKETDLQEKRNKIDEIEKDEKAQELADLDAQVRASLKNTKGPGPKEKEAGGKGIKQLTAVHKQLPGGGAGELPKLRVNSDYGIDIFKGLRTLFDNIGNKFETLISASTNTAFDMIGDMLHGLFGWDKEETKKAIKDTMTKIWDKGIYQGIKSISDSIVETGKWFLQLEKGFVSDTRNEGLIAAMSIFFKKFLGFKPEDSFGTILNTSLSTMTQKIRDGIDAIGSKFGDLAKWWKKISLVDTMKKLVLGAFKSVSPKLYEAITKLDDFTEGTEKLAKDKEVEDEIKKVIDKTEKDKGGGSGTSYGRTATMEELGCGPTVLANALTGKSYTQNDPRWANKTLMGGGAESIDPFTLARSTVNDSNLADSSTGTKGVTPTYFKEAANKVGKDVLDVSPGRMNDVPAGTNMILGSNQHYENATMLGNGLMSVHDPNYEGSYITSVNDKAKEIESSPDLQYAGAVVGGGKGKSFGGGNELRINAQSGRECTVEATKAIYRAYTGKEGTHIGDNWNSVVMNELKASENPFGLGQKEAFEKKVSSHFGAHPDYPVLLYQTGGDGRRGGHPINKGEGNHATVIGRKIHGGKYEIYDSAGGVVHKLDLGQIYDPSAKGGQQGMLSHEGNMLWIPTIAPTSPITQWMTRDATEGIKSTADVDKQKVEIIGAQKILLEANQMKGWKFNENAKGLAEPNKKLTNDVVFVKDSLKFAGIDLSTSNNIDDIYKTFKNKNAVIRPEDARPGDVIFFADTDKQGKKDENGNELKFDGKLTRLGLYVGNGKILMTDPKKGVVEVSADTMEKYIKGAGSIKLGFNVPNLKETDDGRITSKHPGKEAKKSTVKDEDCVDKKEEKTPGLIAQAAKGTLTLSEFASKLAFVAKDFAHQIFTKGKYTGTDWSKYNAGNTDQGKKDDKGKKSGDQSKSGDTNVSAAPDPNFKWNKDRRGDIARAIAKNTGFADPRIILAQMINESGWQFANDLSKVHHNYGGAKWAWDRKDSSGKYTWETEGHDDHGHAYFKSDQDYVNYMSWYYPTYYGKHDLMSSKTPTEWAHRLKLGGYYTSEESEYAANMESIYKKLKAEEPAGGGKGKKKFLGGGGPEELNKLVIGANRIVSQSEYEKAVNSGEGRMSEGPSVPIDKEYNAYKIAAEQDKQDAEHNKREILSIIDSKKYREEPEQVNFSNIMNKRKEQQLQGGGAASTTAETDPHKKAEDQKLDPDSFKGLPLYRQYDTRWGNHIYDTGSIAERGCGPTSMAMIATWATGKDDITPDKASDWSVAHGHSYPGQGTGHGFPDAYAKEFGFGMKSQQASKENVDAGLSKGPLLNNQGPGYFTGGGHYIVIAGKRSDGTYVIHDPNSNKNNVTPTSKIDDKTLLAAADQIWVPEGAKGSLEKSGGTDVSGTGNKSKVSGNIPNNSSPLDGMSAIANITSSIGSIAQTMLFKSLGLNVDPGDPSVSNQNTKNDENKDEAKGEIQQGGTGTVPKIEGPGHGISDMKKSNFKYNEELKKRANTDAISIHHPGTESNIDFSAERIHEMHLVRREPNGELWAGIGYNLVIRKNGDTEEGRPIDYQGAHTCGSKNNSHVFGLVVTGNHQDYDPSPEQMDSLAKTIAEVCVYYGIPCDRKHVTGHCEWNDDGYHGQGGDGSGCPGRKLYAKIPEAIEKAKKLIDDYNAKKKGGGKKKELKGKIKDIKASEFMLPTPDDKAGGGAGQKGAQQVKKLMTDAKKTRKELEGMFDSREFKSMSRPQRQQRVGGGGIKSWIAKQAAKFGLGNQAVQQLQDKLEGHPNIQKALEILDYFDPIGILTLPYDSMKKVDADLRSGKLKPEDLSHLEDDYYHAAGGLGIKKRLGGGASPAAKIDISKRPKLYESPAELSKRYGITYDELQNVQGIDIPDELRITDPADKSKYLKQEHQIALYMKKRKLIDDTIYKHFYNDYNKPSYSKEDMDKSKKMGIPGTISDKEKELYDKIQKHKITFNLSGNILMEDFALPGQLYISEDDRKDRAKFVEKQLKQVETYLKAKEEIDKKKKAIRQKAAMSNIEDTSVSAITDRWDVKFDGLLNVQAEGFEIPKELMITPKDDNKTIYNKQRQQLELYDKKKKQELKEYSSIAPADIAKRWNVKFDDFRNIHMDDFKIPEELKITSKDDPEWSEKQRKQLEMYDKQRKKEKEKDKPKLTGPIKNSVADFFGKGKGPANAIEVSKEEKDLESKIRKYGILFDTDGNIMMEGFKVPNELKLTDEERKNKEKFIAKQNQQIATYLNTKREIEDKKEEVAKSMFELDKNLQPARDDAHKKEKLEREKDEKLKKNAYSTQRQNKFNIKFDDIGNILMDGFEVPSELKITPEEKNFRDLYFNKQTQQVDLWIKYNSKKKDEKRPNFLQKGINSALEYIFGDLDKFKEKKKYRIEDLNSFDIADIYDVKFDEFGNVMMEGFKVPDNLRITKEEIEKSKDDKEIKDAMQVKQHEQLIMYANAKEKNLLDKVKKLGIDPKKMDKRLRKNFLEKGIEAINDFFGIGQMVGKIEKSKEEKDIEAKVKKYKIMTDSFGNIMMPGFTVPPELRINSDEKANSAVYTNKLQKQIELFTRRKTDALVEELKKIQAKKDMFGKLQDEREKKDQEKKREEDIKKQGEANKIAVKNAHFNTQRENKYGLLFDEFGNVKIPSFEVPSELKITEAEKKSRDTFFVKQMQQIDLYVKYRDEERRKRDEENAKKRKQKKGLLGDLFDKDKWKIGKGIETDKYEQLTPAEIAKKYDVQFDEFGNVMMKGFTIPEDLKINKDDDEQTKYSKQRRQLEMLYDQDRTKKREERYSKDLKFHELNPKPNFITKTQNVLKDLIGKFFGQGKMTEFKIEKSREELIIDNNIKKYGIKFDALGNVNMPGFVVPEELRITENEKTSSAIFDTKISQQIGMYNEKAKKELEKQREQAKKIKEEAAKAAKQKAEEKSKKAVEQKSANTVAKDKRLEEEIVRKTREYRLQYDELGNLKMPGFTVPDELKITKDERSNRDIFIQKRLQQIDKYTDFKSKEQQAEEARKAKLKEVRQTSAPVKPVQPNPPIEEVKPKVSTKISEKIIPGETSSEEAMVAYDKVIEARRRKHEELLLQTPPSPVPVEPVQPEIHIEKVEQKEIPSTHREQIPDIPVLDIPKPTELVQENTIPVTPTPTPKPIQTPEAQQHKPIGLSTAKLTNDDVIGQSVTVVVSGITDWSSQNRQVRDAFKNAGFSVNRMTRTPDDLYVLSVSSPTSPGRDGSDLVKSVTGIVQSTGLSIDNNKSTLNASADGTGGYTASFAELNGDYSIENIINTRNKRLAGGGGGFNLKSLLAIGGLVHGASQAGVFGRSTEKRKHRGIGGFFEGMFGHKKKKDEEEIQSTTDQEIENVETEVIEQKPKEIEGTNVPQENKNIIQSASLADLQEMSNTIDWSKEDAFAAPKFGEEPISVIRDKIDQAMKNSAFKEAMSTSTGGGFNLKSLLAIGGLVHGASQAGVFGRSTEKRKHRGIGGFFEGIFGGMFGHKKKKDEEEIQSTTDQEIENVETEVIEQKPKEIKGTNNKNIIQSASLADLQEMSNTIDWSKEDAFAAPKFGEEPISVIRDKIDQAMKNSAFKEAMSTSTGGLVHESSQAGVFGRSTEKRKHRGIGGFFEGIFGGMFGHKKKKDEEEIQSTTNSNIDPYSIAKSNISSSNLADSATGTRGVTPSFFDQAASKYGKQVNQINAYDDAAVKNALSSGNELIAGGRENGGAGIFSNTGHYVNMKGIGGGNVEIRDPNGLSYVTDINNVLPGIRNPEGPNYLAEVGGGSKIDVEYIEKRIDEQKKRNERFFGGGNVTDDTVVQNDFSIGDRYVTSTMNPEGNDLLDAVRELDIKPEMRELITYVKILVDKQDAIISGIGKAGGGYNSYQHGGGSNSKSSNTITQPNMSSSNEKISMANGNKAGSIKNDHRRELEKAYKIARAEGFA